MKLTSQFHRYRPRSRKNEISDISPGQKFFIGLISYVGTPKPFSHTCGYFFKETRFVGKLKQLRFSVGTLEAKLFCVGNIKTKPSFCGQLCKF